MWMFGDVKDLEEERHNDVASSEMATFVSSAQQMVSLLSADDKTPLSPGLDILGCLFL